MCQSEDAFGKIEQPFPDLITGDFDSVDKNVLDFFQNESNVPVVSTPDQNFTDFTKALLVLSEPEKYSEQFKIPDKIDAILAYVESGSATGRPDQVSKKIIVIL